MLLSDGDFIELHGDRGVKDDKAMVGGWGTIDKQSVMFIGQQKGRQHQTKTISVILEWQIQKDTEKH